MKVNTHIYNSLEGKQSSYFIYLTLSKVFDVSAYNTDDYLEALEDYRLLLSLLSVL